MSTPLGLGLPTLNLRTTLPFLTAALHTSSILSGIYFLLNPSEGAKLFGLPFSNPDHPTPSELAYTRLHGVRDLALGALGLRLVNYAYGLEVAGDVAGRRSVGVAIGSFVLLGVGFLVGDGWISGEGIEGGKEGGSDGKEWGGLVLKHVGMGVPIGLLGVAWFYV